MKSIKKQLSQHGKDGFDRKYFAKVLKKYDTDELERLTYLFTGLFNFLDKYLDLRSQKGKEVLEIGCHIGAFAKVLKTEGFDVTAGDISKFIIKKAKKLQKDMLFKVINVENEILINKKFDYVFSIGVVEHLNNPKKAFINIRKKLKKGGSFIFLTPYPCKQAFDDVTHINVHDSDWWVKLGRKTGFKEFKFNYALWIPYIYKLGKRFSIWLPIKINIPPLFISSSYMFYFKN